MRTGGQEAAGSSPVTRTMQSRSFVGKSGFFCNLFGVFKILKTALKSKPKQNGCLSKHREASVLQFQLFNVKV